MADSGQLSETDCLSRFFKGSPLRLSFSWAIVFSLVLCGAFDAAAQTAVLTQHNRDGSSNGQIVFNSPTISLNQLNRPGLLFSNGTIFIAFASHCDYGSYHGWLFAYDASTLTQKSVYVTTPNGGLGGFWMFGSGIAADSSGNIFIASGNGDFDTTNVPATETGDTILKLGTTNQIFRLLDYFTPRDQASLNIATIPA